MSKDNCRQRFKGVENFLRRVAFNLGNTPSQTEVKVISCIPIDVTDLQQKIIQLEKQLEAANGNVKSTTSQRETSIVHTAICNPPCPKYSNTKLSCKAIGCHQSSISLHNQNYSNKQKKSAISFIYPTGTSQAQDCFFSTDASEMTYIKKRNPTEGRKNFFNKRRVPKKNKLKTQLVYYAQTEDKTPFNNYDLADDGTSKNRGNKENNIFGRSYLTDMVRKQYNPGAVNDGTNVSEFSTPICRDVIRTHKVPEPRPYESDMCSCCHGQFRNIDHHMSKHYHFDVISTPTDSNNAYYDSNLYDVVPVKENAMKMKNYDFSKRKEPKNQMEIACCPGNIRPRYKVSPIVVNYNTTAPTRQHTRKTPVKSHNRKEKILNKMSRNPTLCVPINRQIYSKVSKTRSIEFGEVYAKRLERNRRRTSKLTTEKVTNRNDAACLTNGIANTECQTAFGIIANSQQTKNEEVVNVTISEDKTKVTLNQIKEILQSVLTEVKTNSKIGNNSAQMKKKDAVVQNGLSQSNIYGGSSLLQTFTYSPYDMDPYGPSCSQQMQTNASICYPNIPPSSLKCMQHYPLFVQPRRNMCTNCYTDNPQLNKLPNMKRAASTATNTEDLRARSKETENLIKEIYKAMALNIDIPTEDTAVKEHGDLNHTIQNYNTRAEDRETKHVAKAISEIFKNTNPMDTSVSHYTGTPFDSKQTSNETNFKFEPARSYAHSIRNESANYYSNNVNSETVDTDETEQASRKLESDEESDATVVNEETESSVSETETDDDAEEDDVVLAVEEPNKRKEKKGLFSKMLNIFRPRSRNIKKYKGCKKDQPSDSDSVDYRAAHSYRSAVPKPMPKPIITKSRAIVFYSKKPQSRNQSPNSLPRRSPYMEQEYRRYFDEKLTFHDNHHPRSSTRETPRKRPVYYQNVEARSALVDHYNQRNGVQQNSPKEYDTKSMKQYRSNQNQEYYSRGKSNSPERVSIVPPKAIAWLEKHKLGIHCGKQWKKLIIDG